MMKDRVKREIISNLSSDVFSQPHGFLYNWGHYFVIGVVFLFLTLALVIRYPDRIKSQVIITTLNPPTTVKAKASGAIENLFASEGAIVEKDDPLAIISNPGSFDHIKSLTLLIDTLNYQDSTFFNSKFWSLDLSLGSIQPSFDLFYKALEDYRIFTQASAYQRKIAIIERRISQNQSLVLKKRKKLSNLTQQLTIVSKDYDRSNKLFQESVISEKELEMQHQKVLVNQEKVISIDVELGQEVLNLNKLEQEYQDLQQEYKQEQLLTGSSINRSIKNLSSDIRTWDQTYVLRAPMSGRVSFFKRWSVGSNIATDDAFLTIIPSIDQTIIGEALMPIDNSGKVAKGQKVLVYLENYPYQEYGYITGEIEHIALIPNDNSYSLQIIFPDGLITNTNQVIPFQQNLQGSGEIITESVRLLQRFFYTLRETVRN